MSAQSLIHHLGRCHVASGQAVPPAVLQALGYAVCSPCRNLHRLTAECAFCSGRQRSANVSSRGANGRPGAMPSVPPPNGVAETRGTALSAPCPPFSPTMQELLQVQVPTLRHIPSPCRAEFSASLGAILQQLASAPTWESMYSLFALPKMVLRSTARRGKTHAKQLVSTISRRLRLFAQGEYATLWAEATSASVPTSRVRPREGSRRAKGGDLSQGMVDTIRWLVEEGALSKAAKHLVSRGLADRTDPEVAQKLRLLHPHAPEVPLGGDSTLPASIPTSLEVQPEEWETKALEAVASLSLSLHCTTLALR